ncbi:MAG: nitrilase-related carbon-nitrogen hydrolase [Dehalococcoidia bacterium]
MAELSFARPWTAAVVQAPLFGVQSDATAKATQRQNAHRIAEQIDRIVQTWDPSPRLLVYPVLCLTSPRRSVAGVSMEAVAVELPGEEFAPIVEACRRNNCYFASSTQERTSKLPGRFFHTGFLLGPQGLVLRSPKAQAFSAPETTALRDMIDEYEAAFGVGSVLPVAQTELGAFGCLVESELYVPEAARLLRSKGAEIILHPTVESADEARAPELALKQAIAFAAGVYWLSAAASRILGYPGEAPFLGGTSAIVGPDGKIDAMVGGQGDGVATSAINPARLAMARETLARYTAPAKTLYRGLYG